MRRSHSTTLFAFDALDIAASFEEAMQSGLSDEWEMKPVSCQREQNNAWDIWKFEVTHKKSGKVWQRDFSGMDFKSIENVTETINLELAMQAAACAFPELKITGADSKRKTIKVQIIPTAFPVEMTILSECYHALTGEFYPQKFAKLAKLDINCEQLPEVMTSPLMLNSEHIEHGCNRNNVLFANYPTNPGDAIYLTGSDPRIGNWVTGMQMRCVQGRWRYTPPKDMQNVEFKFLLGFGTFDKGRQVNIDELRSAGLLRYEYDGDNRRINPTPEAMPTPRPY